MALPKFFAIKSSHNHKYLRYVHEDGEKHGFLQFSGNELLTPYTKFEVMPASSDSEDGLVHIRCCYNNKYWVRSSLDHKAIVGSADEAEEDQSKRSCTLFKPFQVDSDPLKVGLVHVQHCYRLRLGAIPNAAIDSFLALKANDEPIVELSDAYSFVSLASYPVLPKYISFIGDTNAYLRVNDSYLKYDGNDIGELAAGFETCTNSDGNVRFMSLSKGKFWKIDSKWVLVDTDDKTFNDLNTQFWPVKVKNNIIALRNLGNKSYCKRLTDEVTNCLSASATSITIYAEMVVKEFVVSRKIYNVKYKLKEARVYNRSQLAMVTKTLTNSKEYANDKGKIEFTYIDNRSSSWNSSNSWKVSTSVTLEAGVPLISSMSVKISGEYSGSYEWGETQTKTVTIGTSYEFDVKPRTKVVATLAASVGKCDVPFSYTQTDILYSGEEKTYVMHDGLYTGANCFDLSYETVEIKHN